MNLINHTMIALALLFALAVYGSLADALKPAFPLCHKSPYAMACWKVKADY